MNSEIARLLENSITVGIGQWHVSSADGPNLATFSLGSCIGVTMYDPINGVGGMMHGLLPFRPTSQRSNGNDRKDGMSFPAGIKGLDFARPTNFTTHRANGESQRSVASRKKRRHHHGVTYLLAGEMLEELLRRGASRERLEVRLAGGAASGNAQSTFCVGEQNTSVIREFLVAHRLEAIAEDVGGEISRSMYLSISTGKVLLRGQGKAWEL